MTILQDDGVARRLTYGSLDGLDRQRDEHRLAVLVDAKPADTDGVALAFSTMQRRAQVHAQIAMNQVQHIEAGQAGRRIPCSASLAGSAEAAAAIVLKMPVLPVGTWMTTRIAAGNVAGSERSMVVKGGIAPADPPITTRSRLAISVVCRCVVGC